MSFPYKKLDEVALMVASAIGEELGMTCSVESKEDDSCDGLIFKIKTTGTFLGRPEFELHVSRETIASWFYEGRPE